MSAYGDLMDFLNEGEAVEAIVFGPWGWGTAPDEGGEWERDYHEPENIPVPFSVRGRVLTLAEAKPYMDGWSFDNDFGAPDCYAVTVWTDSRVLFVGEYDGATWLCSVPRNQCETMPEMTGGG